MPKRMSYSLISAFLLLVVWSTCPALAGLNQIVNGSFEDGVVGFWRDPGNQPLPPPWNSWDARAPGHSWGNWNINVDGHDNVPPTPPPHGEHHASVCAGINDNAGGIWQRVTVTPGLTFDLSGSFFAGSAWDAGIWTRAQFWLFSNQPTFNPTTGDLVTTGGVAALNYHGPRTAGWTSFHGGGITATSEYIYVVSRFSVTHPWSAYGMHMDDLTLHIVPGSSMVPEPGTLIALTGFGGMLGLGIRRRRVGRG